MELTHPIDQFCMPPSTNNGCLEADHNGGYLRVCLATLITEGSPDRPARPSC